MSESETTTGVRGRIVVGVDGSEPSKRALRWARFMADATDSDIEAIDAWQPVTAYGWVGVGWTSFAEDWMPGDLAQKVLTQTVDEVFGPDRPANLVLKALEGNPARVLLDSSEGARMIVVGSRGHGGFTDLLLGSVSSACSEHAECPVLVIHGDTPPPPR